MNEVLLLEQRGLSMVHTLPGGQASVTAREHRADAHCHSPPQQNRPETHPASSRCLGPELEMIVTSNSLQGNYGEEIVVAPWNFLFFLLKKSGIIFTPPSALNLPNSNEPIQIAN